MALSSYGVGGPKEDPLPELTPRFANILPPHSTAYVRSAQLRGSQTERGVGKRGFSAYDAKFENKGQGMCYTPRAYIPQTPFEGRGASTARSYLDAQEKERLQPTAPKQKRLRQPPKKYPKVVVFNCAVKTMKSLPFRNLFSHASFILILNPTQIQGRRAPPPRDKLDA